MPRYLTVEIPVDEAARLLRLQPATVRRRLRSRELRAAETIGGAPALVQLRAEDYVRAEDAATLLGVSTSTVRAAIRRGTLTARREDHGRWKVQLRGVLEDRRCDAAAVALFTTGEAVERPVDEPKQPRQHRLHRPVFVRLYEDEVELLDRCVDRHGTQRAAVVEGLRRLDVDGDDDYGELAAEHAVHREELERVRAAHGNLRERMRAGYVDELYCPRCERLVPLEEAGYELAEDGSVELYHLPHGHRPHGGRLRREGTVMGRRAAQPEPGAATA